VSAVAQAMSVVFKKGTFTIEFLREAFRDHVPAPIRSGEADTYMASGCRSVHTACTLCILCTLFKSGNTTEKTNFRGSIQKRGGWINT
jgi:hypothetical protein